MLTRNMFKTVLLSTFVNLFPQENRLHKFILEAHVLHSATGRVPFYTGTGNIVPRLVTYLTDFFEEKKEFLMIFGKIWNFKVVFD